MAVGARAPRGVNEQRHHRRRATPSPPAWQRGPWEESPPRLALHQKSRSTASACALQGRDSSAQGEALGRRYHTMSCALQGRSRPVRQLATRSYRTGYRPFRARSHCPLCPGLRPGLTGRAPAGRQSAGVAVGQRRELAQRRPPRVPVQSHRGHRGALRRGFLLSSAGDADSDRDPLPDAALGGIELTAAALHARYRRLGHESVWLSSDLPPAPPASRAGAGARRRTCRFAPPVSPTRCGDRRPSAADAALGRVVRRRQSARLPLSRVRCSPCTGRAASASRWC